MSFRAKMLVALLSVALVATAVSAGFSLLATSVYFSRYAQSQREARAMSLMPLVIEYYERTGSLDGLQTVFAPHGGPWMMRMRGVRRGDPGWPGWANDRILIFDAAGTVVADSYGTDLRRTLCPIPEDSIPIVLGGQYLGGILVREAARAPGVPPTVRRNVESLEGAFRRSVTIAAVIASLAGALLAFSFGATYSRDLSRRVASLAEASRKLAARDLSYRVPDGPADELGQLARKFNEMAQSLEKAEELRRNFVTDIAHELRTPLSILRANLEAMQEGAVEPSHELVMSLHEEVLRMSRLVSDLQDLSLSEAGRLPLHFEPVDVIDLLSRCRQSVAPRAAAKRISLICEPAVGSSDTPLRVRGDSDRIVQILMNLISNALRHTPEGGVIRLRASAPGDRPREVEISVSNTGSAIPPAELDRIFDRFYRAEGPGSKTTGGTGLGLAVAKALVEAHGGRIWADNDASGPSFHFTLPLWERAEPSAGE